nr:MAG TPA: hypothetical protein [Caudoviricetes sp.]
MDLGCTCRKFYLQILYPHWSKCRHYTIGIYTVSLVE